jgi:Uma2 family endonuclease
MGEQVDPEVPWGAFRIMSTITSPHRAVILYPEDDGQPMAENSLQFQWIVTIKEGLHALFRNNPNVFVAGDMLWYPVEGEPKIRTAPDAMVVFGRPKGHRGSYRQWEEDGAAPQAVFEVLSPGNRYGEMFRKFEFYTKYGVEELYFYDPDRGTLEGWQRSGESLVEIPEMNGFTSPRLGIRFEPGDGPDNLKIIGPDGRPFATYLELFEEREAQRQRVVAEAARADAEHERAERLAAKLRELGIEPE